MIQAPQVTVDVDASRWQREIIRLSAALGKTVGDVIEDQARLLVEELAKLTPPYGSLGGKESFAAQRRIGLKAVEGDVTRLFGSFGDVEAFRGDSKLAARVKLLLRRNDHTALASILQRVGFGIVSPTEVLPQDMEGVHRRHRDKRGRVRRTVPRHWVKERDRNRYLREKKAEVMTLKAGWAPAARMLRARIPANIMRKARPGGGRVLMKTKGVKDPEVTMWNLVSYARGRIGGTAITYALRNRYTRMKRQAEGALRAMARKSTARVNRRR